MQLSRFGSLCFSLALAAATVSPAAVEASESALIGLTDNNTLVRFNSVNPGNARTTPVRGVSGTLVGIDFRPANGLLYGLTDNSSLYTIDPNTGSATLVGVLNVPFNGGLQSGFDFNPSADRLRLVGSDNSNLRVDVTTLGVTVDKPLVYSSTDVNAAADPFITAAGYTNSFAGATSTRLFNIDSNLDVLVIQNPPNDGVLTTVGSLGVDFGPTVGFDIFIDDNGVNYGFAVSGATLYAVDLVTGKATSVGTVGDGSLSLIGLTATKR